MGLVVIFDFLTFFLGLALTALGQFFILVGGADSNFGLAVFSILIVAVGVGISYVREVAASGNGLEREIGRIYGSICFISGIAYIIIPVVRATALLLASPPAMNLGSALLLSFSVIVGIAFLYLGYSWIGAFGSVQEMPPEDSTQSVDEYDYSQSK